MVITFQGTKNSDRKAGAAMVLTAASEALKTGKKVLVMSLMNYAEGQNLEDFVFEKEIKTKNEEQVDILTNRFNYQATGIDAALRKADTGMFTKKDIDSFVTGIFRNKNAFDILETSKQANFEQALSMEKRMSSVQKIIKAAENLYDYIFIYIGYTNDTAAKEINDLAAKIVVVANHGKRREFADSVEKMIHDGRKDDAAIVIYNHEPASIWNIKVLKKAYDVSAVFPFVHDYLFDDAKDSGEIPRFAATNRSTDKSNINADLMKQVYALNDFIDGKEEEKTDILQDEVLRYMREIDESPELSNTITGTDTKDYSERKGLFGKPKSYRTTHVLLNGSSNNDQEEEDDFGISDAKYNENDKDAGKKTSGAEDTDSEDFEEKETDDVKSLAGLSDKQMKEMDAFFDEDEEEDTDEAGEENKAAGELENKAEDGSEAMDDILMDSFFE